MVKARENRLIRIGITMGDPAGIGAEIIVKALAGNSIKQGLIPIVIGDYEGIADALRICNINKTINCISSYERVNKNSEDINIMDLKLLQKNPGNTRKYQQNVDMLPLLTSKRHVNRL